MNPLSRSLFRTLLIPAALACAWHAGAQPVLVVPPTPAATESVPPAPETVATNETQSLENQPAMETTTPGETAPAAPAQQPLKWGPITLHPHASYQYTYNSGIPSSTNAQHSTIIQGVSPGISFDIGKHWNLDYTATINLYSDTNFHNTVNHAINLNGATAYEDWTLKFSQTCLLTADPSTQTAQQTDQENYGTAFNAGYQLNGDLSLDLGLKQNIQVATGFTNAAGSSRDWSTLDWLNRQWGPNLSAGVGVGFGYIDADQGADTTYEQLQTRATWQVRRKISLSVNVGADFRQFVGSSQPVLISPIMGASLRYKPFDFTSILISANRSVAASYFQSQATETTTVDGTISQRLFRRFYLGLNGGFANTVYHGTTTGAGGREDNYDFISFSLGTQFLKRGSASAFYTKSRNSSNTTGFGYASDQAGFQVAYFY
jgi:hypothetical protein